MATAFSIIIPTFNRADKLRKALESVLNQTFCDYEVLVMDDGSTDETRKVVESFNDARLFYDWAPNSGGPAAPRNRGLNFAKGTYIAFLDADDWWHPNKLSKCFEMLQRGYDVVYHELEIVRTISRVGRKLIGSRQLMRPIQIDLLIHGNALATSSVVVRRTIINMTLGFNEHQKMIASEDYNMWLQIAGLTERFHFMSDVLGCYLDDGSGLSNKEMSVSYSEAIYPFLYKLDKSEMRKVRATIHYIKLRHAYLNQNYELVIRSAIEPIKNGPLSIRVKSAFMYCVAIIRRS